MSRRRALAGCLLFAAGAVTGAAVLAAAQSGGEPKAQVLLNVTTDELRWAKTNVRVNLDTWSPGGETGTHRHPGPGIIYVLEGELEQTSTDGTRTLKPGQVIWNAKQTPHNVRNRGERPARALAIHLDPGR